MVWRDGRATLQAGAGIVADSVADDEALECRNKAQALLTAAAAATRLDSERELTSMAPYRALARIDRDVVVVSGPMRRSSCRACSRRISTRSPSARATHALLLEPKGKLVVDLRVARVDDDEWWCVCEAGFGARARAKG